MENFYKAHIKKAHSLWDAFLKEDSIVIDATCGNGLDSLKLIKIISKGKLFSFDIQKKAIENTKMLLNGFENISYFLDSHADFSKFIKKEINLIVYNLGYLPGSDKSITTKVDSTVDSIKSGLSILANNGAISITCYPGHLEGDREEKALYQFLSSLDSRKYSICHHRWVNREKAPSLFWVEKK